MNFDQNPALYQLIGPVESLYQLVPLGGPRRGNLRPQNTQNNNSVVLVPLQQQAIPAPYLDGGEFGVAETSENQFQLVGPIGVAGNELILFNQELYQLAPPNELDAPVQLLAIEGPPQFQLVGPVPRLARIRCRFANETPRSVDLVWTDDNNRMYRYAKLAHEEFVDITTFEGHQWIFCDALDGELYLINPGGLKKFVATPNVDGTARGRRQRISAIRSVEDLTLRKISLRILAQKLFDAWEYAANDGGGLMPPIQLLLQSMRLPPFIQIQLAQFVLSCIVYQMKFECHQLTRVQQQIFNWLVQFVRTPPRTMAR